jgi:SAM-dependent MidA family methyltransferase
VLVEHLHKCITSEGALPFDRFMRECLYAPGIGYYARSQSDPGRRSDFYTSVSVGSVFGRLLADQMVNLWQRHFPESPLILVEQGAHGGQLALDILNHLQKAHPACYQHSRYCVIEPQAGLRSLQETKLLPHRDCLVFFKNLADSGLGSQPIFFISNELLDSFPVKLLSYEEKRWKEHWILEDELGGGFVREKRNVTDPDLLREIERWNLPTLEGYQAEICLESGPWMRNLGRTLSAGFILTMDYGFQASDLYAPERSQGTLSCYSLHQRDHDPLKHPGEKDITAHVNFSLLRQEGEFMGWNTVFFNDQHHALIEAARLGFLHEMEDKILRDPQDEEVRKAIRQFQTLTHPGIMGTQFKFLLQGKGIG